MNDESTQSPAVRKANALFRKETQSRERSAAWAEHNAQEAATREKTARLREARLAKEAAEATEKAAAAKTKKSAKPAAK
jgi:hypothetical protein